MGGTITEEQINNCPRCAMGFDNDGDGNCGFCARLSDSQLLLLVVSRLRTMRSELLAAYGREHRRINPERYC